MRAGRDLRGDFGEVQIHRLGVAMGQDEICTLAVLRTDGAKYRSRRCADRRALTAAFRAWLSAA
jgi:hypothetical protein